VEATQYYGRREAKFMESWYIREEKVLDKACTISVWKQGTYVGYSSAGMEEESRE